MDKYNNLIEKFLKEYHIYHYIKLSKYWILFGDEKKIPSKGLKIHVSSNESIYLETIKKVVPILHKYDFIWKIPNSDHVAKSILNEEKALDINGKLITIYPRNLNEFKNIISILENIEILNKNCIDIRTDKRYKNTCIFFRKYSH